MISQQIRRARCGLIKGKRSTKARFPASVITVFKTVNYVAFTPSSGNFIKSCRAPMIIRPMRVTSFSILRAHKCSNCWENILREAGKSVNAFAPSRKILARNELRERLLRRSFKDWEVYTAWRMCSVDFSGNCWNKLDATKQLVFCALLVIDVLF